MGFILECREAGIPAELLLPIRPPYKNQSTGKMEGGKAPAVPNGFGDWMGLDSWEKCDTLWEVKAEADRNGANAGLILGEHGAVGDDAYCFAAIDIDLNEGQEQHRDKLVNYFAVAWPNSELLIRETVPWRAMLLIKIRQTYSSGRKTVYKIYYGDEHLGKVEVLVTGQQAVIAGMHPTGGLIQWHRHASPDRWRVPQIKLNLPAFDEFLDLAEDIRGHLEKLNQLGYRYGSSTTGHGELVPDAMLVPEWLSVETLIQFIDKTPNGTEVDRDRYVAFMEAIAACKYGLEARKGTLSVEQSERLATHAAEWAAKWAGNTNTENPYAVERAKVDNDWFKQRGGFGTNWSRLITLAQEFGFKGACSDAAQYEFQGLSQPKPVKAVTEDDITINTLPDDVQIPSFIERSETADTTCADYIAYKRKKDQMLAYRPDINRWLVWDGKRNGWKQDYSQSGLVMWHVMMELHEYTAKLGSEWKQSVINNMLSVNKAKNVTTALSIRLQRDPSTIKSSMHHLQTPVGTYDMRSCTPISLPARKEQFDTRFTTVAPDFNNSSTPLFDQLLLGLADGNAEIVDWMWHYLGYCALGNPRADCFVVIWGSGKNGKSVLVKVLSHIFGDYQVQLDNKVLVEGGKNLHPTSLNRLRGKRLAMVSEMPHKEKWNEQLLKQITGGDKISAREMNQPASEFDCEAGLLIVCNEIPTFGRVNQAILRRFRVIGTTQTPDIPDPTLEDKIKLQESSAILAKIMQYAMRVWNPNGLPHEHIMLPPVPEAMIAESEGFLAANDTFFAWAQAECDVGAAAVGAEEEIGVLKARFDAWASRNNKGGGGIVGDNSSDRAFREALRRLGASLTDSKGTPLRKMVTKSGMSTPVNFARGIKLKLKVVA